jgi:aspartokinase-like uncharacterized kinase
VIVVKFGGSLAEAGSIRSWLAALARVGAGQCVLVAGGGVYADTVRAEQLRHGFSDRAAHRMALLAMEQYAVMLADLEPRIVPCTQVGDLRSTLGRGGLPAWLPSEMALADRSIAESWDVSSDTLAAWLARRLGARRLILIKSVAGLDGFPAPERLAAVGLVDAAFPAQVAGAAFDTVWLGPGEQARLAAAINATRGP